MNMKDIKDLESLNYYLEKLEEEKSELKEKINELNDALDFRNWEWMKHERILKHDYRESIPNPRLEMNIFGDRYRCGWVTGLVYPNYADRNNSIFVPLNMTTTTGDCILTSMNPNLPFRDEFHIYSLSRILKLRMFLTRDFDNFIKEIFVGNEFIPNLELFEKNNVII